MSKAALVFFTRGAVSGIGVPTRAEAIARAFTARHTETEGIELQLFGTGDREAIPDWLMTVKNEAKIFSSNEELATALAEYQPDLLLVDSYPGNLVSYLQGPNRPPNVWGVMKNTPGAFGKGQVNPSLYNVFDRLYQIEPGNHGLTFWNSAVTRERTRSIAELEDGVKDRNYQRTPPKDVTEFHLWPEHYRTHRRDSRKLIAPVVNVEPDRVLSREKARESLLAHAELPAEEAGSKKPLVLIALSATKQEYMKAQPWIKQILQDWGIYELPESERLLVQAGAFHEPLPELWRYLPGVDYFLGSCGYNTFYETRYLSALGKFTGQAAFWPVSTQIDQPWRADRQTGLFTGELFKEGLNPLSNGADYLAEAIEIKLKDYVRPEPAPKSVIYTILESKRQRFNTMLDEVYEVVKEVWDCGDNLKEIPHADRGLYHDKNEWYATLLSEYLILPGADEAKVARAKEALDWLEGK